MGEIILLVVLVVLLVGMFVVSYMRKKKYNQGLSSMRDELKKGDKVMTDSGIVGEVVDSYTEEEYKYFVLKSGRGNNVVYYTVHANAIYYVYGKDEANQPKKEVKPEEKKVEYVVAEQILNETKPAEQKIETKPKATKSNGKKKSK